MQQSWISCELESECLMLDITLSELKSLLAPVQVVLVLFDLGQLAAVVILVAELVHLVRKASAPSACISRT